jgi:hypothetical protein
MRALGAANSGVGASERLRLRVFWGTNAERTGEFDRAGPFNAIIRMDLVMTYPKIAQPRCARKWYTAYSQRKNSFYNLNDRSRLGFERPWLYVVPLGFIAAPRAIPHAQSKNHPRQTKGPVASWAVRRDFMCVRELHSPQPEETQRLNGAAPLRELSMRGGSR